MSRLFSYRVHSKKHRFTVAVICFLFIGNAQCQEIEDQVLKLEECCSVIAIDGENRIVYARQKETGRVLQFSVDEVDIRSVKIGDLISATFKDDTAVVTSIAGADRNYATIIRPGNDILDVGSSSLKNLEWPPGDIFRPRKVEDCCNIKANPDLSGTSGRIVVDALEGVSSFRVEVFQAGTSQRIKDWFANASVDLLPGVYDIKLSGVWVMGVTVNRQMDTTILCGALSVNLSDGSQWEVFDEAQETRFTSDFGTGTIALPIGVYAVRIAGGWVRIQIEDGTVTTI